MTDEPILLPYKDPSEVVDVTFDYDVELASGETIVSSVQSVAVRHGTDPSPSSVLSGAASILGGEVIQRIQGGVSGAGYVLRCVATLSSGRVLVRAGVLPVRTLN